MSGQQPLEHGDIQALAAARAELGRDYEPALLDAFAERVEATIEQRVGEALAHARRGSGMERRMAGQQLALGIISLVATIPIAIVLGIHDKGLALLITLTAIVAVNYAHALLGRRG
jgi:hypothetical protein